MQSDENKRLSSCGSAGEPPAFVSNRHVPCMTFGGLYAGKRYGLTAYEMFTDPLLSYEAQVAVRELHGSDDEPAFEFPLGYVADYGGIVEVSHRSMALPKVVRYPIESMHEAMRFTMPSARESTVVARSIDFARIDVGRRRDCTISISAGSPMSRLFNLVNPQLLLRWLRKEPQLVDELLDQIVGFLSEAADLTIEQFGVNRCSAYAFCPGESNALLSPRQVERYAMPALKRVCDTLQAKGVSGLGLHLCGSQNGNLWFYRELPLGPGDSISLDENTSFDEALDVFGEDKVYAGNVPTCYFVSEDPRTVYDYSRGLVSHMRGNGVSFILMPSCSMPINARPENIDAMIRAARDSESC